MGMARMPSQILIAPSATVAPPHAAITNNRFNVSSTEGL